MEVPVPDLSLGLLVFFITYFVLGFLLYSALFAVVGALANSDQEAQNLQWWVIMLLIPPMVLGAYIIMNPNAPPVVVMSLIPFFAPMTMFMRIAVTSPPSLEVAVSLILLFVTTVFVTFVAGRIFRIGILMYGKRPTIREILRWVRYS